MTTFTVNLRGLNPDAVRHLLPDNATQVYVEAQISSLTKGVVTVWYVGHKPDGTPHKRRTSYRFAISPGWFDALTDRGMAMHYLRSALDTERIVVADQKLAQMRSTP